MSDGLNKYQRYRKKMRDNCRCPHCGKEVEGYAECAERREAKRVARNKGIYKRGDNDARITPRIDSKPVIYYEPFIWDMQACGEPIHAHMFD